MRGSTIPPYSPGALTVLVLYRVKRIEMRRTLAAAIVATLILGAIIEGQGVPRLVVSHVSLIDVVMGKAEPDMTVVVEGGRIIAVGKSASVPMPRGASVLDGPAVF